MGLLAALIGVQQGVDVHVADRVSGPKPALVREPGAACHPGPIAGLGRHWDIVVNAPAR